MSYIKVSKVQLSDARYPSDTIFIPRDRSFYDNFPTPAEFHIEKPDNAEYNEIKHNTHILGTLGIWYCRGTKLYFPDNTWIQTESPRPEYRWRWVNSVPQAYIKHGIRNKTEADAFSQKLIKQTYKANLIPFENLELAYKTIAHALLNNYIYFASPNEKTYKEVFAEREFNRDIENITFCTDEARAARMRLLPEQIQYYARVFGLQLDEYYRKNELIKTNHGWAVRPTITTSHFSQLVYDDGEHNRPYAGTLNEDDGGIDIAPYYLQKLSTPKKLNLDDAQLTQLAELIVYYLSLPIQDQITFLADGYDYCWECREFFKISEGCPCGNNPPQTFQEYQLNHDIADPDDENDDSWQSTKTRKAYKR